jgi:aminocarboxymuconate-semialdehyde decarboxylase
LIIDMHAHVFAEAALRKLRKLYGVIVPRLTLDQPEFYDARRRIAMMDERGVDVQVLSVTPGNFCYAAPPEAGTAIAQAQNDAIHGMVMDNPDRFIGSATVPLQDSEATLQELDRSVKDLGFTSVEIGTNVNGANLDSPALESFYDKAEALGVPIIVHPVNNAGADRMTRYYLKNTVGNPMETTLAIGSVIFGGVIERHKGLRFCWVHGGGFLPYQIGRLDHGYRVREEARPNIRKPPSCYLDTMFFDTITHNESALAFLIKGMGADRVLYGTDFPWDMGEYDSIPMIKGMSSLLDEEKARVLGENSARLFKQDGR